MVLQTVAGHRIGEDAEDLKAWMSGLSGCPAVTHTLQTACGSDKHGDSPATWFYVEGDPHNGIARRRCLSCGEVAHLLDSADHWNYPAMWCCKGCQQSIAEVAIGVHAELATDGQPRVSWLAVGVRCVECGRFDGVTDMLVDSLTLDDVANGV